MNSEIELDNIIKIINKSNKIGIFTHISPDGDAVGSSMALYLGLLQLSKEADVIVDEYSKCFNFLSDIDKIKRNSNDVYDLAIVLDCAAYNRLYDKDNCFNKAKLSVAIDHHASNTYFAKYNYVEEMSPATCKTIIKVLKRLNINITKEIGEYLMTGIITDSGGFRYKTTDDETFEFAAKMLDLGVDISDIYYRTFDVKTKQQFLLATTASSRIKFYNKNLIALTYITKADLKKVGANVGDHEGIVNIGRNIEGVEVSIFLREEEKDHYKVSFRSNDYIDVSEIATTFGGGGHAKAAGCEIFLPLDKAIKGLLKEVGKYL